LSANLKRGCGILLIASVVLLSILALLPDADVDHDAGYTSSELSIRETVDGSVTSTSYVNFDGVITEAIDMGYATVCRMRDDNGRVVEERYLDANGDPVARYGDYYGLSFEYDETSMVITYLDAESNPIKLSDGYSTIVRTQVDGRASDDFYYDLNGQQVQCSGGYYLNGFPCMVVVFGCVVCLLMIVLPKSLSVVLTIVYVAFILYETLMFRESGDARTNFVLFSYAGKFLKEQSVRVGVINNIWLFIPLGMGLYRWFQKKWVLVIPFVMSVAIETTQYITGLGLAEFDDVFGNTMGGWIGILTAYAVVSQIS
jgi:glycopeptide antibiotics resistance protein